MCDNFIHLFRIEIKNIQKGSSNFPLTINYYVDYNFRYNRRYNLRQSAYITKTLAPNDLCYYSQKDMQIYKDMIKRLQNKCALFHIDVHASRNLSKRLA